MTPERNTSNVQPVDMQEMGRLLGIAQGSSAIQASWTKRGLGNRSPARYASRQAMTWSGTRFVKHSRVWQRLTEPRSNCQQGPQGNWREMIAWPWPKGAKRRHGLPPKSDRIGLAKDAKWAVPESVAMTRST